MQPAELDQLTGAPARRLKRFVVIGLVAVWVAALLGYLGHLLVGHFMGDLGCEYPAGSSNYGHASWQWWPAGTSCSYGSASAGGFGGVQPHTDRPSLWSAGVFVALVITPLAVLLFTRLARRR